MPQHDLGMKRHVLKILFLNRHGMLRHASLGFLTEGPHAAAWQNHVVACSRDLPNLASFDSFLLLFAHSLIFPLEHHLQDKNKHQNVQNR